MTTDLLADLWNIMSVHVPEKNKSDVAQEFINTLLDYGVEESLIEGLLGVDTYLDSAIEYSIDQEDHENDIIDDEWN